MTVQEFYDYCKGNNCLDYKLVASPGYAVFDVSPNPEKDSEVFSIKQRDLYKQICIVASF